MKHCIVSGCQPAATVSTNVLTRLYKQVRLVVEYKLLKFGKSVVLTGTARGSSPLIVSISAKTQEGDQGACKDRPNDRRSSCSPLTGGAVMNGSSLIEDDETWIRYLKRNQ